MSYDFTCPIPPEVFDDFEPLAFEQTREIRWAHQKIPRFGHTSNLTVLIEGSDEEGSDYVRGMIASSLAIFVFFTVWLLVIIALRYLELQRFGMWSGMIEPLPPEPIRSNEEEQIIDPKETEGQSPSESSSSSARDQETTVRDEDSISGESSTTTTREQQDHELLLYENEEQGKYHPEIINNENSSNSEDTYESENFEERHAEWKELEGRHNRRLAAARGVALFSCVAIYINAIILGVKGVGSLTSSLVSGQDTLDMLKDLLDQAIEIVDSVVAVGTSLKEDMTKLLQQANVFCPSIVPQVCDDIFSATGCNYEGLPLGSEMKSVVEFFQGVQEIKFDDLQSMRGDLVETREFVLKLRRSTEEFNWAFYCSLAFAIALATLCLYLMVGIIHAWRGKQQKAFRFFRGYLVISLFSLLVSLSFVFSVVFIIGSIGTADMCYDSPDPQVLKILRRTQANNSSIIIELLIYIISGCPEGFAPSELLSKALAFTSVAPLLGTLTATVNSARDAIIETCGNDPTVLITSTGIAAQGLCNFAFSIQGANKFMQCSNWNPLYTSATYETLCYNGVDGFVWIATSQFLIVFFSMVLLTLRVSFSKFIDEDENLLQLEKSEASESSEEGARGDMESSSHDGASTSSTFVYNIKV